MLRSRLPKYNGCLRRFITTKPTKIINQLCFWVKHMQQKSKKTSSRLLLLLLGAKYIEFTCDGPIDALQ